jgi:hypothetical protein
VSFVLMQHVWYKTQHHGNAKVLLLALADYANDCCGLAWPAVDTLSAKVGVNLRNTHKLLRQVSTGPHGELEIMLRQGPSHVNLYRLRGVSLETGCRTGHDVSRHQKGCPWRHGEGVGRDTSPLSPATDNLSVDLSRELSEPQTGRSRSLKGKIPICGYDGCDQPECPHSQFCAFHAPCEECLVRADS